MFKLTSKYEMCFGGGGSPPPPQEATPPPQVAKIPDSAQVQKTASASLSANGVNTAAPGSVSLLGDPTSVDDKLGKKSLLG